MVDFFAFIVAVAIIVTTSYFLVNWKKKQDQDREVEKKNKAVTYEDAGREAYAEAESKKQQQQRSAKSNKPKKSIKSKKKASSHPRYIRRFGGHTGTILSMSPSPNGEWMATCGEDGQLRVGRTEKGSTVHLSYVSDRYGKDRIISSLSWESDGRTVACVRRESGHVTFFRMRKKQSSAPNDDNGRASSPKQQSGGKDQFPYELVELTKRKFDTSSKMESVSSCIVDRASPNASVVLTSSGLGKTTNKVTVAAWDGKTGQSIGPASAITGAGVGEGNIRLSPDGRFLCGRAGGSNELKMYEVSRKKRKGEVDTTFAGIHSRSVMTVVLSNGEKVTDVDFFSSSPISTSGETSAVPVSDRAVVCTMEGSVQVWNVGVEYRHGENPRLLCSTGSDGYALHGCGRPILVAASPGGARIALATSDDVLHLFTCLNSSDPPNAALAFDFAMEGAHAGGVGELRFGSETVLYTRGETGKEVFAWNVEK